MLSRHDETDETPSVDGEEAAAARVEAGGPGLCRVQSRVVHGILGTFWKL